MFERVTPLRRFDDAVRKDRHSIESKRRVTPGQSAPTTGEYTVGSADDRAEALADRVADEGMAALVDVGPATPHLLAGGSGDSRIRRSATAGWQSQSSSCESKIRRSASAGSQSSGAAIGSAGGTTDPELSADIDLARTGGRNLEPGVQADVQRAIGHDVSDVKIHTDARADQIARRIQASAFTIGRDIFFAGGQYRPDTTGGMHTLLHESAHATDADSRVQRRTIRRKLSVTTDTFDATFKKGSGAPIRSETADLIPKIRKELKNYHKTKEGSAKRRDALFWLEIHTSRWLDGYEQPKSDDKGTERVLMDLVSTIANEVGLEMAILRVSDDYMKAGKDAAEGGEAGLKNLSHKQAFTDDQMYADRGDITAGRNASARGARKPKGLAPVAPEVEAALTKGMMSLTRAEFAAVHAYTGNDYSYINKNIGGWGKGDFEYDAANKSLTPEGKANKEQYEEAGLHAGFIAQAFRKLPIWKGTTFRGMTMATDFLGLTTNAQYKANDYWSTSEAKSVSQSFLKTSAGEAKTPPTMAAMCTINVSNGRDVARMSNVPEEVEILLPPGSIYAISNRRCLTRGKDDDEIKAEFGQQFFNAWKEVKEFWLIEITQTFSDDNDVVGAYPTEPKAQPKWKGGDANQVVANFKARPIGLGGDRKINAGSRT